MALSSGASRKGGAELFDESGQSWSRICQRVLAYITENEVTFFLPVIGQMLLIVLVPTEHDGEVCGFVFDFIRFTIL